MKESLYRERCFAYLLNELSEQDKAAFEDKLSIDEGLSSELRECSEDLAKYSQASCEDLKPSAYVWAGIEETLFGEREERIGVIALWWRRSPKLLIAACLLLILNLSLTFREMGALPTNGGVEFVSTEDAESDSDGATVSSIELEKKIEAMNERVDELKDQIVVQLKLRDIERIRIEELEAERLLLALEIDELENEYLDVVGLGGGKKSGENKENELRQGSRAKILIGSDASDPSGTFVSNDIWARLKDSLPSAGLAILDFKKSVLVVPDGTSVEDFDQLGLNSPFLRGDTVELSDHFYADGAFYQGLTGQGPSLEDLFVEETVPYLVSILNEESNQAIVSVGNLPEISEDEEYRVWDYDVESGEVFDMGAVDSSEWNSNLNIAIQVSEEEELLGDFMISIEPRGTNIERPSRIIIRP